MVFFKKLFGNAVDEPRINMGKLEDGVLTISESFSELDAESLEDYKRLIKIVFPASLKKLDSYVINDQKKLEVVDLSKVTQLKEIPDDFISGKTCIKEFKIPQGVEVVGDGFLGECGADTKVFIPASVKKLGYINGNSDNNQIVYLFASNLDISDVEQDIKTLYVLPDYYGYYAKQLKDCDSEARLREMPKYKMNVYGSIESEQVSTSEIKDNLPQDDVSSFRKKKLMDLEEARDHKNESTEARSKWMQAAKDVRDIDRLISRGANTLNDLKEALKHNLPLSREINELIESLTGPQKPSSTVKNEANESISNNSSTSDSKVAEPEMATDVKEEMNSNDSGLFSARLEALINSALQDGVLTEQEKAILKKRAEAEGEDWDEVEMIISARLAEKQREKTETKENIPHTTSQTQKVVKEAKYPQENRNSDNQIVGSLVMASNDEKTLVIQEGIIQINQNDYNFSHIENVIFPSTLKVIGSRAFEKCNNLEVFDFSQCPQLEVISDHAFSNCLNLKKIIFPPSLKTLGEYAFENSINLEFADFSTCEQLMEIEKCAFQNCKKLTTLDFSHCISLSKFHEEALYGCDNVHLIDFSGCQCLSFQYLDVPIDNLEKIILPSGQKGLDYYKYWGDYINVVDISHVNIKRISTEFCEVKMKEIIIPDSVEVITNGSFDNCTNLKTIVMPASLKEIKGALGKRMGMLKKIDFSKVKNLKTIPTKFLGWSCDCEKLKELIIPQGVKEIEDNALDGLYKMKRLFLPPTLESIGDLGHEKLSIYCFSPSLEELEPIVYGWDDEDDDEDDDVNWDDEEDNLEDKKEEKKKMKINLYVLPQYIDKYIAQRRAERIPEEILVIQEIPDEYRFYYDN